MQASDNKHCAILFCDERVNDAAPAPTSSHHPSSVPPPTPPRAYH
jgi:hypothetical protein